jgi:hypothetical protein
LLSHQYFVCIPLTSHSCYMTCPSLSPLLDHSNYTWRRVQVTKLLIMHFSPICHHFIMDNILETLTLSEHWRVSVRVKL